MGRDVIVRQASANHGGALYQPRQGFGQIDFRSYCRRVYQYVNESIGRAARPSWPGGVAARSREAAQQPKPRRRGGCSNTADWRLNYHPVCGVKELSRLFLDATATPPGREGARSRPVDSFTPGMTARFYPSNQTIARLKVFNSEFFVRNRRPGFPAAILHSVLKRVPLAALLAVAVVCTTTVAHNPGMYLSWNREISRVFYNRCAVCHRPDGSAFSLMTYPE